MGRKRRSWPTTPAGRSAAALHVSFEPRADALLKGVIHGRQFLGSGGTHFARCSPPRP